MLYRCHYNVNQRAENRNKKPLDVVEQDGMMDALLAIACEILVPGGSRCLN
ncbi:MAG: hypothetical protein WBB28_27185 [Crinalium sp.]